MSNPCCAQMVCARRKKNACLCSWAGLVGGGQVCETAATIRGRKTDRPPIFTQCELRKLAVATSSASGASLGRNTQGQGESVVEEHAGRAPL
eukprot:6548733-Prymnesium_polylepis.1